MIVSQTFAINFLSAERFGKAYSGDIFLTLKIFKYPVRCRIVVLNTRGEASGGDNKKTEARLLPLIEVFHLGF